MPYTPELRALVLADVQRTGEIIPTARRHGVSEGALRAWMAGGGTKRLPRPKIAVNIAATRRRRSVPITVDYEGPNYPATVPLADEVATCPPHYWLVETGKQTCRKCGEGKKVDVLSDWIDL